MLTDQAKTEIKETKTVINFYSSGTWKANFIEEAAKSLKKYINNISTQKDFIWDVSKVDNADSAGIILFIKSIDLLKAKGCKVKIIGHSEEQAKMYELLKNNLSTVPITTKENFNFFENTGKKTIDYIKGFLLFISFIGESFHHFLYYIMHPSSIRFKAIVKNLEESAVRALGIIALTSFLIGVVIAFQSAVQLEKFGANIFVIDMIGISVTRELAPLITAIVVAGRSGSSYTAQIGVMKLTEEIDAMKTMGFEPFRFLVLPRMIALMIAMPLLIFFADLVGIFGGMVVAKFQLHISFAEFIRRLQGALDVSHFWVGIIKGPFFAWLIAAIGCFRGFQVSRDTESIGYYTTVSVVNAIFLVIACDAIFSVFLTEVGI